MIKNKVLSWIVVVLWMILIFSFSSQVGEQSNQLSTGLTVVIVSLIERIIPKVSIDINVLNNILRKISHFVIFLIFGLLVMNALSRSFVNKKNIILYASLICILYAVTDEVHQLFVPNRGMQFLDVIIDITGSLLGIYAYLSFKKIVSILFLKN